MLLNEVKYSEKGKHIVPLNNSEPFQLKHKAGTRIFLSTSGRSLLHTSTVFNFVFQLSAREVSVETSCRSQNWKQFGEVGVLEIRVVGDQGSTENCTHQPC